MSTNVHKKPALFKHLDLSDTRVPDARLPGDVVVATGLSLKGYIAAPQRLRFTFAAVAIAITDTGGVNGAHGSLKLFDASAGLVAFEGALSDLAIAAAAGIGATGTVVCGLGTAAVGTDNSTLTSTEQDLIPSTAVVLAASAGNFKGEATSTEGNKLFDGTATAKDIYLNFAIADADVSANSTLTLTGFVDVWVLHMGDN